MRVLKVSRLQADAKVKGDHECIGAGIPVAGA